MGKQPKVPQNPNPLAQIYENFGMPEPGITYPGRIVQVENPELSRIFEEKRWLTVRDRLGKVGAGIIGLEEEAIKKDYYEEIVEDPDGYLRKYQFAKDLETGEVTKLGLVQDAEAIKIEEIQQGKQKDPRQDRDLQNFLLGKMFADTDPETGKFYKDSGISIYDQAIGNSIPKYLLSLGLRTFSSNPNDKVANRYPGAEPFVNRLSIDENGDLKYDDKKLALPDVIKNDVYEWFVKETSAEVSGFVDSFVSAGITMALDLPFYLMGGGIAGRMLNKIAPAFMKSSTLLASVPKYQLQTFTAMMLGETPRTVVHTLDGGVDAFLEDVKHIGQFSLMAGVGSAVGEQVGIGISKLFSRPKQTSFDSLVDILRKNPQMVATISGGFSSGALGYVVGGEGYEERLASAMLFASMHFATPSAWKTFARSQDKNVMVGTDGYENLVLAMRNGRSLHEAIRETRITEPDYYIRQGDNLYEINKNIFTKYGIIEKVSDVPIKYSNNPSEYRYITEAIPFYRKLYKDAIKDVRLSRIADKIEAEGFREIRNPYPPNTEEYLTFEYTKRSTAEKLALIHYSKDMYKQIQRNGLPDIPSIKEILRLNAEGLKLPERVYRQMIEDYFTEYAKNPEQFIGKLKSEGGSLNFLPEDYRRSFESALPQIEVQVKRFMNSLIAKNIDRLAERMVNDDLVNKLRHAKDMQDLNKILEETGWSTKVFEELQKRIKATTLDEAGLSDFIKEQGERFTADKLDYQGGVEILRRNYRHWERMLELLTPDEIRELGRTGALPEQIKSALDALDVDIGKSLENLSAPKEPAETASTKVIEEPVVTQSNIERIEAVKISPDGKMTTHDVPVAGKPKVNDPNITVEVVPTRAMAVHEVPDSSNREKTMYLTGKVLDRVLDTETGRPTDWVVFQPDNPNITGGKPFVTHQNKIIGETMPRVAVFSALFGENPRVVWEYTIDEPVNLAGTLRKSGTEWELRLDVNRKLYDLLDADVYKLFKMSDEEISRAKDFNSNFARFFEDSILPGAERTKRYLDHTVALPELVKRLENSIAEILESPILTQAERDYIKREYKKYEKIFTIAKYLDHVRVVVDDKIARYNGTTDPQALGTFVTISRTNRRGTIAEQAMDSGIFPALMSINAEFHRQNSLGLLDTLAHESIHALLSVRKPGTKYPTTAENIYGKRFLDFHSYIIDKINETLPRLKDTTSIEGQYLKFSMDYVRSKSVEELVTLALTEDSFATWLASIPGSKTLPNKKYTAFHRLIDNMKSFIVEKFGLNKTGFDRDFLSKEQYTALDELGDIFSEWLKERGLTDPDGQVFRKGVGEREVLQHYADALERAGDPDNYYKKLLKETDEVYETALLELGEKELLGKHRLQKAFETSAITEASKSEMNIGEGEIGGGSGIEPTAKNSFIAKETLNTAQIEGGQYNILPNTNLTTMDKTFDSGARPVKLSVVEHDFAPIPDAYKPVNPKPEVKKSIEADYGKDTAGTRKAKKPKEIAQIDKVREERQKAEVDYINTAEYMHKGKSEKVLPSPKDLVHRMYVDNRMYRVSKSLKNYFYQTIVPVYRKDLAPRFRDEVYTYGEELIRYAPYYFNTIVKRIDGWRGGQAWRDFTKPDRVTGLATTVEGQTFLQAFRDYEYGRYSGKIERELTWDEFSEWAKFTPSQKRMLDIYRGTLRSAIEVMKDLKVRYLVELEPAFASKYLKEKRLAELTKEYNLDPQADIDEFLNKTPDVKEKYARKLIEDNYADWDKTVYYNSVRPVSPSTVILEFSKPTGKVDADGNPILDRVRTYAESRTEGQEILNEMLRKGWTKDEMYEVSDIIKHPDQWGKLRAEQLLKLAEEGHIPYNNEVLQSLLEVTKKGVDIHSIRKEYIPGMKYTAKEFEGQLIDFLREAIYGSYKSYTLSKIQDNLLKWRGELNDITKGLSKISDKGIDDKTLRDLEAEYKYAYGYFNQLKAPERSVIDKLRGLTFSYLIGGVKPSFLFMQSIQNLQMGIHIASKELGGNFAMASRLLGEASSEAMNYALALKAKKKGLSLEGFPYDKELLDLLQKFENMGKLKAVGISEMSGVEVEPDFYYSSKSNRMFEQFIRVSNILGAGVEKLTRVQATSLFYKVGKNKGLSGGELEKFILDNLDKSMTEFGKGGRAPLFESKSAIPNQGTLTTALKKSFLSLKTFSFYNYSLYHNLIREKAWGALMSKAMVGMGLHGIKRFPLMAGLFMIAGLFTDEDIDYKAMKLADDLDDIMPVKLGSFLDRGLASALGTGLDFSNTFAEDSPLLTDMIANTYSKGWEGKLLEISLGAPLGFSKNVVTGGQEFYSIVKDNIINDEFLTEKQRISKFQRLVKIPPLWIQNILRAMEYEKYGVTLRGNEIVKREDLTAWDIVLKAMSFPVEKVNLGYLEKQYGIDTKINKQKQIITTAKQYMKELRTDRKLPIEIKLKEIAKAEESMKEAKKQIILLEKEKKEKEK